MVKTSVGADDSDDAEADDNEDQDADDDAEADDNEDQDAHVPNKKPRPANSKGRANKPRIARDKVVKFARTDDPYNIPPESWFAFSRWIVESQRWFPAEFGGALVDFSAHCHHYTADMWRTFAFHLAPILFRPRAGDNQKSTQAARAAGAAVSRSADDDAILGLPMEDYIEFVNLVKAIKSAVAYSHTADTINKLEERMLQFSRYV